MTRTFEDKPAVLDKVPLLGGLIGPSGSGKTFSALRLATGIQRVSGGDIFVIDTEANRAKHYARDFKFRHLEFKAPFCPLDYLAAIQHCVSKGAGVIVVDSMSHEHEGEGGVLEQHAKESERLAKEWRTSASAVNFPAWQEPKRRRTKLIQTVVQLGVSAIFCFRAKEKSKPFKRGDIIDGERQEKAGLQELGWMPIAGEEFVYEMGFNLLLEPGSDGRPTLFPEEVGTKRIIKLPGQFRKIIDGKTQLSESIGESLARWANGDMVAKPAAQTHPTPQPQKPRGDIEDVESRLQIAPDDERESLFVECKEFAWTPDERKRLAVYLPKKQASQPATPNPDEDGR